VLFGSYKNFPKNVHVIASFYFQDPVKSVQQAILRTFHRLNSEVHDLGAVTPYLRQKCEVTFEFGIAEGDIFNFLDENELDRCLWDIDENKCQTLDFFFVVRYHTTGERGGKLPLRFDYHVLRFTFQENCLNMQVRHVRGIQRVQLDDLTDFIAKRINAEFSRRHLNPLALAHFKKVGLQ
jgi:hypothetical protein